MAVSGAPEVTESPTHPVPAPQTFSDPAAAHEVRHHEESRDRHEGQDGGVGGAHPQLGHEFEVHAVHAGDEASAGMKMVEMMVSTFITSFRRLLTLER